MQYNRNMQALASPWLDELHKREPYHLAQLHNQEHDIVIIGAGIAGIVTAYYLLTTTRYAVTIFEGNTIASGATGHNAGQLTGYLERPFADIVREYGTAMATQGQQAINQAWELLASIRTNTQAKTPLYLFEGLSGCAYWQPTYTHLESRYFRPTISHQREFCLIADDCDFLDRIPTHFTDLYTVVPRRLILDLLQTNDPSYSAAFTARKGCMNTALFCEELTSYLLERYANRFQIYEHAQVNAITLGSQRVQITIEGTPPLLADKVILCTNGFQTVTIRNQAGAAINTAQHEAVHGKIGYMKAYAYKGQVEPIATSYYNTASYNEYFYLTRRPIRPQRGHADGLLSIGGPEYTLPDKALYTPSHAYPQAVSHAIDAFVGNVLATAPATYERTYIWHGLMGYTNNGLRLIGPDQRNKRLLYNLGCNGVGILPAIYGGLRIAQYLRGDALPPSIFDPTI